jgi:hypothetical protein
MHDRGHSKNTEENTEEEDKTGKPCCGCVFKYGVLSKTLLPGEYTQLAGWAGAGWTLLGW